MTETNRDQERVRRSHLRRRQYDPRFPKTTIMTTPNGICMICSEEAPEIHHRLCEKHFPDDGQTHIYCVTCGEEYVVMNGDAIALREIHKNLITDFGADAKPQLFIRINACKSCDRDQEAGNIHLDFYVIRIFPKRN